MLGRAIAAAPIAAASLRVLATEVIGPGPGGVSPSSTGDPERRGTRIPAETEARATRP
jgi:hypothetical protein